MSTLSNSIPKLADISVTDPQKLQTAFQDYLTFALNAWLGPELGYTRYHQVMAYLECETDFFTAPASTRFHEVYEGGLCAHSLKVMNEALLLAQSERFSKIGVSVPAVIVCALLHDVCKVNKYEGYWRNVKDENTGRWEQVRSYRYKTDGPLPLGHGEKSAYLLTKLLPETTEEMVLAVRWHMGLWDCPESGKGDLSSACNRYPLVHLIQFADMLSITEY